MMFKFNISAKHVHLKAKPGRLATEFLFSVYYSCIEPFMCAHSHQVNIPIYI